MAEILGAVASGLSIARATGDILSIGLKLKGLLEEIRDAPESFKLLLGQVEILATALHDLNLDSVTEADISVTLCGSLRAATIQCQNAAEQLACALNDLSTQLETNRGFRRKVVAAKMVFKKGSLAKLEHRLYTAVQCLTLTQQLYIIAWQRIQPDIIASRILQECELTTSSGFSSLSSKYEDNGVALQTRRARVKSTTSRTVSTPVYVDRPTGHALQIGTPSLTGKVRVETLLQDEGEDKLQVSTSVSKTVGLGIKFHMPSWLASRMVAISVEKSCVGWQASLAVYRIHGLDEPQARKTMEVILSDDTHALHQAFERRQIGPQDRFFDTSGNECTLNELALKFGAWRICNHLSTSSHDFLQRPLLWFTWQRRALNNENLNQLQTLVKKDNFGVHVRFQLLSSFHGDVLAFDSTRRQIWSDDLFYSDSFRNHRIQFAWFLALSPNALAPTFFRHVLSPRGALRAQDIYTGSLHLGFWDDTLLHALALGVGSAAWHDKETSRNWALIASEVLPLVNNYHELAPAAHWDKLRTPLFTSLFISLLPWPLTKAQNRSSMISLSRRFHHMEIGMKAWLRVLKDAGVNLQKYGEREAELFNSEIHGRNFPSYSVSHGGEICWNDYLRLDLVLVGFQYGQEVNEWKLWWSEHTDVYAGDFWNLIESSVGSSDQRVPGAWVEDQESEIIQTSGTVGKSCSDRTSTDANAIKY